MRRLSISFLCLWIAMLAWCDCLAAATVCSVCDHGAIGDGKTLSTAAIQKTIDTAASQGGGTVQFPPGRYLSGTLWMKSGVTLQLDAGATLLGSTDPKDYPEKLPKIRSYTDQYVRQALIAGEDLERIAICGRGTVNGQGAAFHWKEYRNRPYIIRFVNCRDVLTEGVTLQNSAMWMQHYLACDRVRLRGVRVFNHVSYNNDGLDIDACHDVCVSECMFDSDDDALCLKSTLDRACENVTVSNCVLSSHCNALKMGTESHGGFQNIAITNCTIRSPQHSQALSGRAAGMGGIALEIVNGGAMDRVTISNVAIQGVLVPVFVRLGNRARPFVPGRPKPPVGTLRNLQHQQRGRDRRIGNRLFDHRPARQPGGEREPEQPADHLRRRRQGTASFGSRARARGEIPGGLDVRRAASLRVLLPPRERAADVRRPFANRGAGRPARHRGRRCMRFGDPRPGGRGHAGWTCPYPAYAGPQRVDRRFPAPGRDRHAASAGRRRTQRITLLGNDLSTVGHILDAAPNVPHDALFSEANRPSGRKN